MDNFNSRIGSLVSLALKDKLFPRRDSLIYHFKDVFEDVDVSNKKVLDIGGGIGILSFYAGVMGAQKAICLEPESDGSSSGMISEFNSFKKKLDEALPVEQLPLTLQEYLLRADEKFDIVILNNSINHLNEPACINLQKDKASYDEYIRMSSSLYNIMNANATLIITDCSDKNFFHTLGMESPFIRGIEWHKHQHPKTWAKLLNKVGFKNPKINWSSPNRLGELGRMTMKNAFVAYFTSSHFRLQMEK